MALIISAETLIYSDLQRNIFRFVISATGAVFG